MKNIKYILMSIILSFLFIINVCADYNATAINPSGAKCSLKLNSTGYCFYENSNLNSINYMGWLDTGDSVTVITSKSAIPSPNKDLCPGEYVYISQYYTKKNTTYYGYYCNTYLSSGALTDSLKSEFSNLGFPESYFEKLAIMKTAHPNWTFKAINTNLNFNDAVYGEVYRAGWSLVQRSSSNNYAYMAIDSTSFDYKNDYYIAYDSIGSSDAWYNANKDTISYYMDPRNFLNDMYIFQFEGLSYDSDVSQDSYKTIVKNLLSGDYLEKFTDTFVEAGEKSKVSPVYLASLSKQEVGGHSSCTTAVCGVSENYNGIYNFYNIGATGGENPVYNGLSYASYTDDSTLRPWNSEYKAIVGGALWIGKKYISVGQDTSYFKKWNVVYNYIKSKGETPRNSNYEHQYMTNILAPSSEALSSYKSVVASNLIDSYYTFYIPVYNNMPSKTSLPTNSGWPNNYLSSIRINDLAVADFDGDVETYNYYLDVNSNSIKIDATPVNSSATVTGMGTFNITDNTTKQIIVKAQNGNTKTYKINIILTGEKRKPATDLQTTMNNSGIKNSDAYLSGISLGSDISIIKTKITNANSAALVELKNSSGKPKESGVVATGDKVTVSLNDEVKTYEVVIYGDVNGDGIISASDYAIVKYSILGKTTISGVYKKAGDVNKDGLIGAPDYGIIKYSILGKTVIVQ